MPDHETSAGTTDTWITSSQVIVLPPTRSQPDGDDDKRGPDQAGCDARGQQLARQRGQHRRRESRVGADREPRRRPAGEQRPGSGSPRNQRDDTTCRPARSYGSRSRRAGRADHGRPSRLTETRAGSPRQASSHVGPSSILTLDSRLPGRKVPRSPSAGPSVPASSVPGSPLRWRAAAEQQVRTLCGVLTRQCGSAAGGPVGSPVGGRGIFLRTGDRAAPDDHLAAGPDRGRVAAATQRRHGHR